MLRLVRYTRLTVPPSEAVRPNLWINANYLKVHEGGRIVSAAIMLAVGVNTDGSQGVLCMDIGASEAEPFWIGFLSDLVRRGCSSVNW